MTTTTLSFSRAGVEALAAQRGDPSWLRELRLAAWDSFAAIQWPTIKDAGWGRIEVSDFALDSFAPHTAPSGAAPDAGDALFLQRDSVGAQIGAAPAGVIAMDLDTALREREDEVRALLGSVVPATSDKFTALHYAFLSGGVYIHVPKGTAVEAPLRSLRWLGSQQAAMFAHTLVHVERGGSLTLIEDALSADDTLGLHAGITELVVGDNAQLRHVVIQEFGAGVQSFDFVRANLGRDATLNSLAIALGGSRSRLQLEAAINSPGVSAEMLGVFFGEGSQQFDIHTLQDHIAPNTGSDLLYKGILKDTASSLFSGLIRVAPGAQKTDAYQANRNLLLSDKARADSLPTLEIEANDVRCTHGATAGPLEQDHVFYLMARGIPRREAERAIVAGFLDPVVSRIPIESVRDRIHATIARKMG